MQRAIVGMRLPNKTNFQVCEQYEEHSQDETYDRADSYWSCKEDRGVRDNKIQSD